MFFHRFLNNSQFANRKSQIKIKSTVFYKEQKHGFFPLITPDNLRFKYGPRFCLKSGTERYGTAGLIGNCSRCAGDFIGRIDG